MKTSMGLSHNKWLVGIAVLASAALCSPKSAAEDVVITKEELAEMRKTQIEMRQQMKEQKTRIEELEQQVHTAGASVPASYQFSSPVAEALSVDEKDKEAMRWSDFTYGTKTRIKLYGFARVDAIHDDSAPNNTLVPAYIRSEDPLAPGAVRAKKNNDDFLIHPRLTRLGMDLFGPEIPSFCDAKVSGKIEIDFYNSGLLGQAESREAIRMRHAYVKLDWDDFSLLGGQTNDVISPLAPIVNPDFVMWGAGNLGDRRPQLRGEYHKEICDSKFIFQGEIGTTGADDNQDLDPAGTPGNGYRDGETSGKPTLQARAAYAHKLWEKESLEFGVWAHKSWQQPDAMPAVAAGVPYVGSTSFESHVFGFDLSTPIYKDMVWFKAEGWSGRNLSDVRGGILQGINLANGREIRATGGFVELGAKNPLAKWHKIYLGYSTDNPNDHDLPTAGRTLNRVWYVGNRFNFDPIEIGFDYLNWRTEYKGFRDGTDNRFQSYISFKF